VLLFYFAHNIWSEIGGFVLLPWSTLMYLTVYPGGIFGFEWVLIGLGIFADMAGYFGGYKNKNRMPYGDQIP
jgi:hypothetical protein